MTEDYYKKFPRLRETIEQAVLDLKAKGITNPTPDECAEAFANRLKRNIAIMQSVMDGGEFAQAYSDYVYNKINGDA